ncbi:MAG: RNA polymerase sigma factor [Ignavibacteriae bacterium]|nr:MAG: RNA polymerase sigma factor [Ignavibacteriota bacterium]
MIDRSSSDRDLIDAMRVQGDDAESAFRVLYDRHAGRIYLYACKILRSESLGADVVHDTLLKLLLAIRDGTEFENVPAFLLRTARNLCLNMRKRNQVVFVEPSDVDPADHVNTDAEQRDLHEHVLRAIDLLPVLHREALILQLYAGLSYAEICEVTGESLPVIRHRISRAKQRLRNSLLPLITE